jgi:glutathione S-transferase
METLLFYSPNACSLGAMVVLEWIAEPYRLCRVEVSLRGTDAYKRFNPLGQVPALKLGDRILTENGAILPHLAHRRPELGLIPERDLVNQWLSYLGSNFHPAFYPYFSTQRYIKDPSLYPQVKEMAVQNVRERLAFVNKALEKREYLAGTRSILDPYLYAMTRWSNKLVDLPRDYPRVRTHQELMEQDPAVRFALAMERGEPLPSPSGKFAGSVDLNAL